MANDPTEATTPEHARRPSVEPLHRCARGLALLLTVVCIASFVGGRSIIEQAPGLMQVVGIALIGMAGSGLGALTSLLSRYAAGFQLDDGTRIPADAEGELYGRRIAFCMLMRPVLGLLIAPLLVAGIAMFLKEHQEFKSNHDAVTVVAFIGGLYAKSAIEAAKNAFKVVFRA